MERPIQVKELNRYIKKYLAMDYFLGKVYVEGELSNFKEHSNGNLYFSLKDEGAKISCTMFRRKREKTLPVMKDGMKIRVRGSVSYYEKEGILQLYAEEIEDAGQGELYAAFLKMKEKLEKEGLFAEGRKKKIPEYVQKLGVITSPEGAAFRDILNVAGRRNPHLEILLFPSVVQGIHAPGMLTEGVKTMSRRTDLDLIIIGRGGGAYEDLAAFNDEALARAVAACPIPVISAVGHETDFTIVDFVADLRAPTPSAAAELAIFPLEDRLKQLDLYYHRLLRETVHKLGMEKKSLELLEKKLEPFRPAERMEEYRQKQDELFLRSVEGMDRILFKERETLSRLYLKMREFEPGLRLSRETGKSEVLNRRLHTGFQRYLTKRQRQLLELKDRLYKVKDNYPAYPAEGPAGLITSASDVRTGDLINIYLPDGRIGAEVKGTESYEG